MTHAKYMKVTHFPHYCKFSDTRKEKTDIRLVIVEKLPANIV